MYLSLDNVPNDGALRRARQPLGQHRERHRRAELRHHHRQRLRQSPGGGRRQRRDLRRHRQRRPLGLPPEQSPASPASAPTRSSATTATILLHAANFGSGSRLDGGADNDNLYSGEGRPTGCRVARARQHLRQRRQRLALRRSGLDKLFGGIGDDIFVTLGGQSTDEASGGGGIDTFWVDDPASDRMKDARRRRGEGRRS